MFRYKKSLIISIILHVVVLSILVISFTSQKIQPIVVKAPTNTVKAVAVSAQEVEKTLKHLRYQRELARKHEIAHQRLLKNQAAALRQKAQQEKAEAVALKKELAQLEKQKQAEALKMQEVQKQKLLEEQKMAEKKKALEEADKKLQESLKQQAKIQEIEKARAAKKLAEETMRQEKLRIAQLRAQEAQGVIDKYKALLLQTIASHWYWPAGANKKLETHLRVHLAKDGEVLAVVMTQSSGSTSLDRSAMSAVYKSSPLPVPSDATAFKTFRQIEITMRPEHLMAT